jgi:WD40 repeat protein
MRHDDVVLGVGFEFADAGPQRSRAGRPRYRRWTRGRIALLLTAIGLPWLPIFQAPQGDPPMHRARGEAGTSICSLAFSPDGQTIAVTDDRGRVRLRPVVAGRGIDRELDLRSYAWVASFSPDGRYLAVGRDEPDVALFDLGREGHGRLLGVPVRETNRLRFSPDGRTLAMASARSSEIILWDLEAGRRRMTLRGHTPPVTDLTFADDGRSLASVAHPEPVVLLWDLDTGRPRRVVTEPAAITSAFTPDGHLLATASADLRTVRLWDLRSGGRVQLIAGLPAAIRLLAFSPDGRLLAMGAGDRSVGLWSVATGRELWRLDAQAEVLHNVAFAPDGRILAATGNDDDIQFWDLDGIGDREGRNPG